MRMIPIPRTDTFSAECPFVESVCGIGIIPTCSSSENAWEMGRKAHSQSNARLNQAKKLPRRLWSHIVVEFLPGDTAKSQRLANAVNRSFEGMSRVVKGLIYVVVNTRERRLVFPSASERHNHDCCFIDDHDPSSRPWPLLHMELRAYVSPPSPQSTHISLRLTIIYAMKTTARNERQKARADVLPYS